MRKRTGKIWIVGVLACLLTVLLLPGGSMKTEAADSFCLFIDGETHNTNEDMEGNFWSYTAATNTLTLRGGSYECERPDYANALSVNQDLNLVLVGENRIICNNNSGINRDYSGIYVEGNLTISGDGELTVTGGGKNKKGNCYGIKVKGNLTIDNGKIDATGKASEDSVGIYADGDITINGGTVKATGNTAYSTAGTSKGIHCGGTYVQNDGDVAVTSNNDNSSSDGTGLYAGKDIKITSGKLRSGNSKSSVGIKCDGIYTQTGGEVKATSTGIYDEKLGLKAAGIKFEGDKLTLEGNTRAYEITGRSDSEQTNEKNITWTKASVLKASNFTITPPDGIYNGKEQEVTVTPKEGINCGAVTVKYYNKDKGTYAPMNGKPTALGDYKFEINVAGSSSYAETTLQDENWKFTIAYHKLQKVNAKAATCTDEGNIAYYKCSECRLCFKNSDGTEQLTEDAIKIAKKDHEGAEPVVYTWNEKHTTCTAVIKCKNCDKVIDEAEGIISSKVTKEANCTEKGEITYTAAFPKDSVYVKQTEKVTVAALGHVEPEDDGDCTTAVICERCKAVIKDAKEHNWSDSWTKDASGHWHACQNDGCTKKKDEAAHTPDIPVPTDDTDQKCTFCEYIIAPKKSHEHTLQKIEAKEATCTTPGNKEYYKCETCGHFFADEAATQEVMEGDMIIPARGHDYANLVYTWSEDYTTCTAVQKCNNCDTVNATEKVNSTSSVTQSQSCTAPELTTYTATFTSETFAVQKKVVQTKEAAGHMPGDWIVDRLATVTEEGSRHKECSVCKAIVKTEIIEKLPYISSDTTKPDSSNEETVTNRTEINAAGKSVSVTTTVRKDASGKVISTVQTKEIVDAAKDTSVTVTSVTDGEGKTSVKADVVTSGTKSASGTKGTISSDVVAQIIEAAGTTDIVITQKVVDQDGKIAYTVSINAKDLTSGEKFIVVKYNKKTGKYTLCNKKIYKVTDAGVSLTIKNSGSYQLISEADAAKLVKEILATVKPAKKSKTVKEGNAASFAWSKELDIANVSKITYSSTDNSIAKIGKNGKITAKKAGKVTLKATVTLKNGKKKVVSMKLSVRAK